MPTVAALRERADEIVERVLAENEARWEWLTQADRERLEAMARAIASRLLHEPTLRLKRAAGDDDAYAHVSALRELFGLDAESEPLEGEARGSPARRSRAQAPRHLSRRLRCGHPRQRLALAQASTVADALGGGELVTIDARRDGEPGDKERFVRGVERGAPRRRGRPGGSLGQGPARRPPDGLALVGVPGRADPPTPSSATPRRWTSCREGARVGTSSLRRRSQLLALRPDLEWSSCMATSTPACASWRTASTTGSCSPLRACAGSAATSEIAFRFGLEEMTPAAGQGSLALEARRDDATAAARGGADHTTTMRWWS